jgi:tRNA-specific 2-thiouridylase
MARAVSLLSGGLDSSLAILAVIKQGVEVDAIRFVTPFECDVSQILPYPPFLKVGIIDSYNPYREMNAARRFCSHIEIHHLGDKFIEIVKNPPHGYGKNMNPCIDCRIIMLREAKLYMDKTGADFIVTGEVLGQRPMSQRRDTFCLIDREAGVTDYVLRPLSAKLLKITFPEMNGIVNREMLYDFSGRSRKPQIALAKELGLTDYPAPAGGCLLTERNYSYRLKDLFTYNPAPEIRDICLLKIGRHFRFSPSCKIVVGRDSTENEIIESLSVNGDCLSKIEGYGSPTTLLTGEITDEAVKVAASLCARYSDAKNLFEVESIVIKGDNTFRLRVSPAGDETVEALRIEKIRPGKIAKALQEPL